MGRGDAHDQNDRRHAAGPGQDAVTAGTAATGGPADEFPAPRLERAAVPATLGQYRILSLLGEGGMGAVYEAEQQKPRRRVALKVIRGAGASPESMRRFEHEAEVLARLQHPGIAQVYEAGVFEPHASPRADDQSSSRRDSSTSADTHSVAPPLGRPATPPLLPSPIPFFAMELIRGLPLTRFAEERRLGTRERLGLMVKICEAVQHAHAKGIIHRDLKPANILVDESGQPKILDFGIARLTGSDVQATTLRTDIGQLIGTIPYMSPEQAAGDPHDLDTRSDVYALGVVCYELLAGRLPHDLRRKMIHEAVRVIREDEPTPLSSINRVFRGDVETIVGKALAKEKPRRYQTAAELGADIARYLGHEPIAARPPSSWYQLRKFATRNRVLVAGVAATFVALVAGIAASGIALRRARQAEAAERQRGDELAEVSEFQASQLRGIDPRVMGERLRESLESEIRAGLERDGAGPERVDEALEQFGGAVSHANLTNVAMAALDENVFARAVKAVDDRFGAQPLVKAELLQTLADTMIQLGLQDKAEEPLSEALAIRKRELGEEHGDYLISLNSMGMLLMSRGRLAEAEGCLRAAVDGKRRALGDDHVSTLASLSSLGRLLRDRGAYAEAEQVCREVLERRVRLLGEDHPDTLMSLNVLSELLRTQGRLAEAERYSRAALERNRRVLGPLNQDTLQSLNNTGVLLVDQGKWPEAETFWRAALEGRRRVLGDDHPDTLISINNMGFLYRAQGRFEEAEPFLREALDRKRRVLGEDHPSTLASLSNMGLLLYSLGRYGEAEPFWRGAMEARRRVLGDTHPQTLSSINNMGLLMRSTGRAPDAEQFFREALVGRRRALGEDHGETIDSVYSLGDLLRETGRLDEAGTLLADALERSRRTAGPEHPDTLIVLGGWARFLHASTRLGEAEVAYREVLGVTGRVLGADHPKALAAAQLGRLLTDTERWDEAEGVLTSAADLALAAHHPHRESLEMLRGALAALYEARDRGAPGSEGSGRAGAWEARFDAALGVVVRRRP